MKLLLTTIKTEKPATELAMRYLYDIVFEAPIDTSMKLYECESTDFFIYEEIVRNQYDIVYFHCDEFNVHRVSSLAEMVKKACPSIIVVVGGMTVSFDTKEYMAYNPWVDYVIRGEGETVFYNFLKTLLRYEYDFELVPGLGFRRGSDILVNSFDKVVSMESLPFPYAKSELEDTKVVYYETIRGTTDRSAHTLFMPDPRVRTLPLDRIYTELRYFIAREVEKVVVLDKYFNYSPEKAYKIFDYLISNDNGKTNYEFYMDGNNIDDEIVRLLGKARKDMFIFNIDVASINPETLAIIGRDENAYKTLYNVTKLLENDNVTVKLSITAGLPFETEELFARSFNKVFGLGNGKTLHINEMKLPKGSLLRKESEQFGYIYKESAPFDVLGNDFIHANQLILIRDISVLTDKFVSEQFNVQVREILNESGLKPYTFFKEFAEYAYREELMQDIADGRNLHTILNSFAAQLYEKEEKLEQ